MSAWSAREPRPRLIYDLLSQTGRISARKIGDLRVSPADLELRGAGDENRTRTISLGSASVTAARGADLAFLAVLSDRG